MIRLTSFVLLCFALCGPLRSQATLQTPDLIVVNGDTLHMHASPLFSWLNAEGNREKMGPAVCTTSTGCWRGYRATWQLDNGKLYLTQVIPYPNQKISADLKAVFGADYVDGRVFADWVDGDFFATWGEYGEIGTMVPLHEYQRFLTFEKGDVVTDTTYHNWDSTKKGVPVWNSKEAWGQILKRINTKIRWAKLKDEHLKEEMSLHLHISPNGELRVTGRDFPEQYISEFTRILKGMRWNLYSKRGEVQAANLFKFLRLDLQSRTIYYEFQFGIPMIKE